MAIYAAYQHDVTDEDGNLLTNVQVRVVNETSAALPQLYDGPNTSTANALGNPFTQADGKVYFHCGGGQYKITYTVSGYADRVLRYVPIGRAQGTDLQTTTPMGAWDNGTTYNQGDLVTHPAGGDMFVSLGNSNLNHEPDDTTPGDTAYWMWIGSAAKGDPGEIQSSNDTVLDIIKLTQAEYDLLTPTATTLYVIVG